ncbi:hypothetical protein ACFIJ5_18825 (plasmid) [Haloimpatiens sp. FM7330]|uniref:hypothetical protein n=1 Tax=Haloimpatiens sp. FM7330 TaxID=3298610 RepID=UPI00363C578D
MNSEKVKELILRSKIEQISEVTILMLGQSGSGKSTAIKKLISKKYRKAFDVLDGRINTTPVIMFYLFSKNLNRMNISLLLKNKSYLKELIVRNLVNAFIKYYKQFFSGRGTNLSKDESIEFDKRELNKVIYKDNTNFCNISKLMIDDNELKEEYLKKVIEINSEMIDIVTSIQIKANEKVEEEKLSNLINQFLTNICSNVIDDIVEMIYNKGIEILKDYGYTHIETIEKDENVYFKNDFKDEEEAKQGLKAISNSNLSRNKKFKSAICIVDEVYLNVPTELESSMENFKNILVIDPYGTSQDGTLKMIENAKSLLSSIRRDSVILFKRQDENNKDFDRLVKSINECNPSCMIIPVITKIDTAIDGDFEDAIEDIAELQENMLTVLKEEITPKSKIRIPDSTSDIFVYGNNKMIDEFNKSELEINYVLNKIFRKILDNIEKERKKINIKFIEDVDDRKVFGLKGDINKYVEDIQKILRESICAEFHRYAANAEDFNGNSISGLLGAYISGEGYSSDCHYRKNIYTEPFLTMKSEIVEYFENNNNTFYTSDKVKIENKKDELYEELNKQFNIEMYKSVKRVFSFDNFNNNECKNSNKLCLVDLWKCNKEGKLQGISKIIDNIVNNEEKLKLIISTAFEEASRKTIQRLVIKK